MVVVVDVNVVKGKFIEVVASIVVDVALEVVAVGVDVVVVVEIDSAI